MVLSEAALTQEGAGPAAGAVVVSVSAVSRATAELLGSRLPQVRPVACRSTGYDNVDLAYARAHRIAVFTTRVMVAARR